MDPVVSIVIPTKNRFELLRETIASVAGQTYPHWEAIMVDDGSANDTVEAARVLAMTDPRLKFVKRERPPAGASTCRNIGLSLAAGKYLVFLDSDDLLAPFCLEQRVTIMEENEELVYATFPTRLFQKKPGDSPLFWNAFTREDDLDRFLKLDLPWQTAGPIWRRSSLLAAGLAWDEEAQSWQDWEFHIRALACGLKYVKCPQPDSYYRLTQPGAISFESHRPVHAAKRGPMLLRVGSFLREKKVLSPLRQGLMEAQIVSHAFYLGVKYPAGFKYLSAARRAGLVGNGAFLAISLIQIAVRPVTRMNYILERRFVPGLHSLAKGTLLSAQRPVLGELDDANDRAAA